MFFGTTPAVISNFLADEIKKHNPARVIVPFAGNFVVEKIASIVNPNVKIICTDVSLYSRAIGYYLSGVDSAIKVKSEIIEEFPGLKNYGNTERNAIAVVMLGEVARSRKKMNQPFYKTQVEDCRKNSEEYAEKISKKLQNFKETFKNNDFEFLGSDGILLCERAEKGDLVFYDPPVILGDYEKMFAPLEEMFDFDIPEYTQMTDEVKEKNLLSFSKKKITAYYRTNHILENIPQKYVQVFQYRYKYHSFYCVYTNNPSGKYVGTFVPLKETQIPIKIIQKTDDINPETQISVIKCKGPVANHFRLLWVKKAEMADAGIPYLIFADEKMIGLVVLMPGIQFSHEMAVILSDPACPTSKYKRLSKLILYIVCTREMLKMFNDDTMWEHNVFTTRVFTNEAVSMKYRSLFELAERKSDPSGNYQNVLIYQNKGKILGTFKDGLMEWLKKDSKHEK